MKNESQVRDSFKKIVTESMAEIKRLHGDGFVKYAVTAAAFERISRLCSFKTATDAELYWVVTVFGKQPEDKNTFTDTPSLEEVIKGV